MTQEQKAKVEHSFKYAIRLNMSMKKKSEAVTSYQDGWDDAIKWIIEQSKKKQITKIFKDDEK